MTESTHARRAPQMTPRPEADADASRPGDHGAHHKGRTNPIPETRGLRPRRGRGDTRPLEPHRTLIGSVFVPSDVNERA